MAKDQLIDAEGNPYTEPPGYAPEPLPPSCINCGEEEGTVYACGEGWIGQECLTGREVEG